MKQTLPQVPGLGACTTTVHYRSGVGTIRSLKDGQAIREVVDLDGDGQPEEVRTLTMDGEGRVVGVETSAADGAILKRETKTWDGRRMLTHATDRWQADGRPGPDGTPDEVVTLTWNGDDLQTESVDQLDADGILGVDGKPEIVTTWSYEAGKRTVGEQVDARDSAVLRRETLTWNGEEIAQHAIDLGGDGEIDVTMTNSYKNGRIVRAKFGGSVAVTEVTYEYCR